MIKILIISQYMAPTRAIASIRWSKIAKYLKKDHDVEIDVLTDKKNYDGSDIIHDYKIDDLLQNEIHIFNEFLEFKTGTKEKVIFSIKQLLKRGKGSKTTNIKTIDISSGNSKFVPGSLKHTINSFLSNVTTREYYCDALKKYYRTNKKYDVVISTYGPIWTHLVAERIKNENSSVFWVADFRDIYAGNPYETEHEFNKHKRFVSTHLMKANVITKVAEGLNLYENQNQFVVTLSNGYDEQEKREPKPPKRFMMLYTGSFYPNETDLSLVFRAVRELIDEGKMDISDVDIIYAGKQGNVFCRQAEKYKLGTVVIDKGFLQRESALDLQQNCAILLQSYCYTKEFNSLWSGKMFEYMMAKKPIVFSVIGDTPSEQYKLMPKLGGIGVESCNIEKTFSPMKKYIENKYNEWIETGDVSIVRDDEYINSFSYARISEQFWHLIEGVQ